MPKIFISENGDWGDADGISLIDSTGWTDDDFEALRCSTWSMLMDFADNHGGLSPSAYYAKLDDEREVTA